MKSKYLIVKVLGLDLPILFPEAIQHDEVLKLAAKEPVSAGFYEVIDGKVFVHGFSISLDLDHRAEDAAIIERFLK